LKKYLTFPVEKQSLLQLTVVDKQRGSELHNEKGTPTST